MCLHNSARSQMAEAWLNYLHGDQFEARSAGLEPGTLNPLAVKVMEEVGIDISRKIPRKVFDFVTGGELFSYVITVCDQDGAERCPHFPGFTKRMHWNFTDPATFTGSEEEKMEKIRKIRDELKEKMEAWVEEAKSETIPLFNNS